MSTKSVRTVDNFDIKIHQRYAADQANLDKKYITDSVNAGPYFEVVATTSTYSSKLATLLESNKRNICWAAFPEPAEFSSQRNRFFAFQILTNFHWIDDHEREEDETLEYEEEQGDLSEERKKELQQKILRDEKLVLIYVNELISRIEELEKTADSRRLFEKEKTCMLNLINCIRYLNSMIAQVKTRRLQQKG